MAYIVKSSLEIKPTILSTRDIEALRKDKEEYLRKNGKIDIPKEAIIPETETNELKGEEVIDIPEETIEHKHIRKSKGSGK